MWNLKTFKTHSAMTAWIEANRYRYQIQVIYINNVPAACEYKPLRIIA